MEQDGQVEPIRLRVPRTEAIGRLLEYTEMPHAERQMEDVFLLADVGQFAQVCICASGRWCWQSLPK